MCAYPHIPGTLRLTCGAQSAVHVATWMMRSVMSVGLSVSRALDLPSFPRLQLPSRPSASIHKVATSFAER